VSIPADAFRPLPVPPSLLGESPFWHPGERALYWLDIPGHCLNRYQPDSQAHHQWPLPSEPGSIAPLLGGGLLIAMRDGLWRFDTASGERRRIAEPPYDPAKQRFNDGKADAHGRFWVGTIDDKREPKAALFCLDHGTLERVADGITTSNGLAWSPDARTLYWADTPAHTVFAFDFERAGGAISNQRVFAQFPRKAPDQNLAAYGGRPDGAAVDTEGGYWVAMYEGARLLRLGPDGAITREIALPVRCPTMPCFGGPDLQTLYITTARDKRPADELAREPLAGCVLQLRVDVPGLPANLARL
jgi:sugar lactone lactonase YvrE